MSASEPAAISSARAARKLGVATLDGVFCRSRARFWASAQTRATSAGAASAAGPSSVNDSSRGGSASGSSPRKRSKR